MVHSSQGLRWTGMVMVGKTRKRWWNIGFRYLVTILRLENGSWLTHYQVDRLRTGYATFGQEQLLDIELDRNTPLAPQRDNSISWQTPSQSVVARQMSMPRPTRPVTGETDMPDGDVSAGASLSSEADASGRILTI